jgi:hypothetical protein
LSRPTQLAPALQVLLSFAVLQVVPVPSSIDTTETEHVPSLLLPIIGWQFLHCMHAEALQHTPSRQLAKPA